MRRSFRLAVILPFVMACGGPTGPSDGETMTALIDGQPFGPNELYASLLDFSGHQTLNVIGLEGCRTTVQVFVEQTGGSIVTGTYTVGATGATRVSGTLNVNSDGWS